jgi:FAD/FMN-containing dehydrogenase
VVHIPSRQAATLLAALRSTVGAAHVLTDAEVTASYETDWTGRYYGRAQAVVRPADAAQVAVVLQTSGQAAVAVVVQGGNTGLVGGGVPVGGEVLLSTRRLNAVGEVENAGGAATVVVGAGATLAVVQAAVRPQGWDLGVDLGSRGSATVGGMAATNAGGERVLRHGPMRAQVAGLEAVLADGSVVGRLARSPKDNAGYDLEQLLVGSEGTLAVLTRLRLSLVPLARRRAVALVAVGGAAAALEVLAYLRGHLPRTLGAAELMFADGLALVRAATGLAAPFRAEHPAFLLVEVDDAGAGDQDDDLAAELASAVSECVVVRDAVLASDARGVAELWRYREAHTEALASGRPLKLDVSVPLTALPGFVDELGPYIRAVAAGAVGAVGARCSDPRTIVFGHLAEGNLHVNVLGLDAAAGSARRELAVADAVLRRVAALGGSISAEHGIGRAKVDWLHLSRSAADLAAMAAVKRALDPAGLLAPGVLLPARVTENGRS